VSLRKKVSHNVRKIWGKLKDCNRKGNVNLQGGSLRKFPNIFEKGQLSGVAIPYSSMHCQRLLENVERMGGGRVQQKKVQEESCSQIWINLRDEGELFPRELSGKKGQKGSRSVTEENTGTVAVQREKALGEL